jgi:hypothetical protein
VLYAAEDGGEREFMNVGGFTLLDHRWYRARVSVRGTHIVCTLHDDNENEVIRLREDKYDRFPSGQVGLATGNSSYRFKNIKVTAPDGRVLWEFLPAIDPSRSEKVPGTVGSAGGAETHSFQPLFNGRDLTGWKDLGLNKPGWKVETGLLIGRADTSNRVQSLVTDRADFSDFRLKVRVMNTDDNQRLRSIAIRSSFNDTSYNGYLIVVGGKASSHGTILPVGTICKADNRPHNWVISWNALAEPAPIAVGEWYDFEVTAIGKQITTSVNGRKVAEYVDGAGPFTSGAITLTYYRTSIQYKDILIEEFPRERKAESSGTAGDR